ncbi:MAG: radical SAM protein [Prevotellaceae bacterium]|jgi:uncharacterized protein|nr:radical SAM protein [Prevotellaceae bacterium]
MLIKCVILKVTSICNLSCKYCYVYNKTDKSYLNEPDIIDFVTVKQLLQKIEQYCKKNKLNSFLIIFHGGEPLIAGKSFYEEFIKLAEKIVISAKLYYSIQTNGTLLTETFCKLFKKHNIHVCISIDGNETASNNRIFKTTGHAAYNNIIAGYNIATKYVTPSVLSVINTSTDIDEYYTFFKDISVSYMDCLPPDSTYEKFDMNANQLGLWLIKLFDVWYFDKSKHKPRIRMFEDTINLFFGNENYAGGELFGRNFNGAIDIRTNGNIDIVDTLRICENNFLVGKYNIMNNELDDIIKEDIFYKFYNAHQDDVLCEKCRNCIVKDVCGGGLLTYRFSAKNSFNNPSVYCFDIFLLLMYIQNTLIEYTSPKLLQQVNLTKISMQDYIRTILY